MENGKNSVIKKAAKDSMFASFFDDRRNVFELYKELHPEDLESTEKDIVVCTPERMSMTGCVNGLSFHIRNMMVCIMYAQSRQLKPMTPKVMFYLYESSLEYIDAKGLGLSSLDDISAYDIRIIETGPGGQACKVRSIPADLRKDPAMDPMEVEEGCLIDGFMKACRTIDDEIAEDGDSDPVTAAVRVFGACRGRCGRIGESVWSRRSEVMGVYKQLFIEEENRKMFYEAGKSDGSESGKAEAAKRMLSKGMTAEEASELSGVPLEEVLQMANGS